MKTAFVHDHRFPRCNGQYYSSSGFDVIFTKRYLNLFNKVKIMARHEDFPDDATNKTDVLVDKNLDFYTVFSSKDIFTLEGYGRWKKELLDCDCAIIRLPSILGLVGAKICKENRIPYLIEMVGCPWDALGLQGRLYKLAASVYAWLTKIIVADAKYTVYVTEKFLEKRYPTKGKYIACSNVALNNYGSIDLSNRLKKIKQLSPGQRLILGTCGALEATYKCHEDGIRVLKMLRNHGIEAHYQLVGGGRQERLRSIAHNLGVETYIEFLGELNHEDVFQWLDTIDIYVHPSRQEGLSRAIIEAMSRGCPVVAADAGGIHEQIDDAYIFSKGDVKTFASMVMMLAQSKKGMISQAAKNYKRAENYRGDVLEERRKVFFEEFIKAMQC